MPQPTPASPHRRIIRLRTVREMTSLSRNAVESLEAQGDFPRRVQLSRRIAGWYEDEVLAWLASLPRRAP